MKANLIDASQLELQDKVVSIKRVVKVVKGGRTMRFTALVVVGDGNGHVGAGLGKSAEIPEAIRKGKEDAMKKLVSVARDENGSITHDFIGKFGSAEMLLKRAPEGTGVIAGGPARAVVELAGIRNIRAKCMGSRRHRKKLPESAENPWMIFWRKGDMKMADKLKVTLVKSPIGAVPKHKKTVEAMGLRKLNKTVELPDNPCTRGMIQQVQYMVKVEEA